MRSEMFNLRAIPRLFWPSANNATTSRSRLVSESNRPSADGGAEFLSCPASAARRGAAEPVLPVPPPSIEAGECANRYVEGSATRRAR